MQGERGIARVHRSEFDIEPAHGHEFVQAVSAIHFDGWHLAGVQHGMAVYESGCLGGAGDGELGIGDPAPEGAECAAEPAAVLESGTGLADRDWAGHPDLGHLLGVSLDVAPSHREVFIDPDVCGPAESLALVCAPDDDEDFFVLRTCWVEEFVEVVAAALPVGPDDGHRAGIVVGESERCWQELSDVGRVGAKLDGHHFAAVVPRR